MSRQRIYVEGRPQWQDEGPGRARPAGHGGVSLGWFQGVHVAPTIRRPSDLARERRRAETKRLWREANPDHRVRTQAGRLAASEAAAKREVGL